MHVRVPDQAVLQLNRGDPLPTGLDDVLGAVGQSDEALLVDTANVAGAQPAGVELGLVASPVIGAGDPRAANFHLADGFAVVGQHLAVVVDDPGFHAAQRLSLRCARKAQCCSSGAPGGGHAMVAIGDVSVMPHSCRIWTPCRSSKVRISDTGTAEPPQITSRSDEMSWSGSFSRQCMTSFQMVGTAPATVGRSDLDHVDQRRGVEMAIG